MTGTRDSLATPPGGSAGLGVAGMSRDELRRLAEVAAAELEDADATEVIRWAVDTFGPLFTLTSSMNDAVLAHLADRVAPGIPMIFLDTGYMHVETLGMRDAVAAVHQVQVRTVHPPRSVADQDRELGADLFARDPDRCCALRKVAPLDAALAGFVAWGTGLRRDETPQRSGTPIVGFDHRRGKVKVAPIARWTAQDVDTYIAEHGVLVNPLVSDGYLSVGCEPCTARPLPGTHPRGGRWPGVAKTECGIHQ